METDNRMGLWEYANGLTEMVRWLTKALETGDLTGKPDFFERVELAKKESEEFKAKMEKALSSDNPDERAKYDTSSYLWYSPNLFGTLRALGERAQTQQLDFTEAIKEFFAEIVSVEELNTKKHGRPY